MDAWVQNTVFRSRDSGAKVAMLEITWIPHIADNHHESLARQNNTTGFITHWLFHYKTR